MLTLLFLACSGMSMDSSKTQESQTSTDSATDSGTTTTPACATVNPGKDWAWHGDCPQMTTPVAIAVDDCTLTLTYDGMTMGMPYAGTIDGDTVTFDDGDSVNGCIGTVMSADDIEGTCGRCDYTLTR